MTKHDGIEKIEKHNFQKIILRANLDVKVTKYQVKACAKTAEIGILSAVFKKMLSP